MRRRPVIFPEIAGNFRSVLSHGTHTTLLQHRRRSLWDVIVIIIIPLCRAAFFFLRDNVAVVNARINRGRRVLNGEKSSDNNLSTRLRRVRRRSLLYTGNVGGTRVIGLSFFFPSTNPKTGDPSRNWTDVPPPRLLLATKVQRERTH